MQRPEFCKEAGVALPPSLVTSSSWHCRLGVCRSRALRGSGLHSSLSPHWGTIRPLKAHVQAVSVSVGQCPSHGNGRTQFSEQGRGSGFREAAILCRVGGTEGQGSWVGPQVGSPCFTWNNRPSWLQVREEGRASLRSSHQQQVGEPSSREVGA